MNPQLMAMLNGMYGGIPSNTDGIMPLGSGFAGQQLPQQDVQTQMSPQGGMPNMPLGSGMYGMGAEAQPQGNFALGSGLYGQQMPSPQDMQQGGQQAAASTSSTEDKFSQLMNNPMFQYGMGLVGAMHTTNPWGGGMNAFLQAQGQQAKIKQANAAAAAEAMRVQLEAQRVAQEKRQWEENAPQREATLGATNAGTGLVTAQAGAIPSEVAHRDATTGLVTAQTAAIPAHTDLETQQAANLRAEAGINAQKLKILIAQAPLQMSIYEKMNWALQHMGQPGGGAPAAAPSAAPSQGAPTLQPQSAPGQSPGGAGWSAINTSFNNGTGTDGSTPSASRTNPNGGGAPPLAERAQVLQDELATETNPANREALMRELSNITSGSATPGAPGRVPAMQPVVDQQGQVHQVPSAVQQSTRPDPGLEWNQLGMFSSVAGMPGGPEMQAYGKSQEPQTFSGDAYRHDPTTGKDTFYPAPTTVAKLKMEADKNAREAARQNYEIGSPGAPSTGGAANNSPSGASAGSLPQSAIDSVNKDRLLTADKELQKSYDANKELPKQITAIRRARADVEAGVYAGTTGDYKKAAVKAYTDAFGRAPDPKVVNSEDFNSAMAQLWMTSVKQVDQNPTERQMNSIRDSFGSLANDPAALKNILKETENSFMATAQRHNRAVQQYETKMGPDPYSRYIAIPEPDAPRPPPASASLAAPASKLAPPKAGEVRGNYVFLGGDRDPADPKSWAPKPKGK